jgi:hypothetical protein
VSLGFVFLFAYSSHAQQTLGAISGTVTDISGATVAAANVTIHNVATNFEESTNSHADGAFSFFDLPIGAYRVTFSKDGFKKEVYTEILVQGNRTTTLAAKLQPGEITASVEVSASPLLNQVDTTNGYVLGELTIESAPLGTGSFTQLAILAPGVNADLLSGSGSNAGLGNQAIWANGQRETSNSFSVDGIDANNIFNGSTSSQVAANRFVLNTNQIGAGGEGEIQTDTSVYSAVGQSLPTPPQETIEEIRVNTSMYDASQGANSGAHIELTTKSGTSQYHGQAYEYHQTSALNAAPFFRNADPTIAASDKVPRLHRNQFGGLIGGPILKDKLFFFASYQGVRLSDELNATSHVAVPLDLTAAVNRSDPNALAQVANTDFGTTLTGANVDPVALKLLQAKLPNGQFLIPNSSGAALASGGDTTLQSVGRFRADQANGNLDYNLNTKDRFSLKYYYQYDPSTSPFAESNTLGFPQSLTAGSHVVSLGNTIVLTPNLTWELKGGYIRQTAFAGTAQPFAPSAVGMNIFGSKLFPNIFIGNNAESVASFGSNPNFNLGPTNNFANAGFFQNKFTAASNVNWVHGRHTVSTGFNYAFAQLNIINLNNQVANLSFADFPSFLTGTLNVSGLNTAYFNGTSNRYYRAPQVGTYVQDDIKLTKNVTLDVGLRFDWDGALYEKNGLLTNFYPKDYQYDLATDTIQNIGLVVAGDNKQFGTKGVSNSTLTGRQWLFEPRIGIAWSPAFLKNVVVRAGAGLYADRGEFFTEFSPSAGGGFNGPFGVTLEPPFVVPFVPTGATTLSAPFGTAAPPPPPTNLSGVASLLPNQAALEGGASPFLFGGYDPANKLPYSENWSLDVQWQPVNTLVMTLAYIGNHGVHGTIPIPFNEPHIATATHPVNGQTVSYGFNPVDPVSGGTLLSEPFNTSTGGNTDLRVPFIGFSPNSVSYEAEGNANYNALQFSMNKRLSHGLQINGSYTWSHSLDDQSGLGLFYNGNDPLNPKSGYASSDFDRTHVISISYLYELPKLTSGESLKTKLANGWAVSGITVLQSGQPYSVTDFSGAIAGIFFSANDFITNPIVPLLPGVTPAQAQLQGTTGVNAGKPVLDQSKFGVPFLQPGQMGVPQCGPTTTSATANFCDTVETGFGNSGRNLFRGPFQSRFDFSVIKETRLTERFSLKYTAQFFNIFNHPSFDTPNNNVFFNQSFNPPAYNLGPGGTPIPSGSLGVIQHPIGSPRFVQMALHLTF